MNPITIIIITSIALASIIVICLSIWLHKQKRQEKQKRLNLATDSAKRIKLYWDELCASGEGYFDDDIDNTFNHYVIPDMTTKRSIASINIGSDEHIIWTSYNNSKNLKKEIFDDKENVLIIAKVKYGELPYIINEKVYTFDEKESDVKTSYRTKAYINYDEYLNKDSEEKPQSEMKTEEQKEKQKPVLESECDIKYEYQLIFVRDNKIKIFWFNTEDAAKGQMRDMLNKIGHVKANFGDIYNTNNRSYNLNHFSATYRANKTKCDWLIIKLP